MDAISSFLLDTAPVGIIVYGPGMEVVLMNRRAGRFLRRYAAPPELADISRRILEAMARGEVANRFPGEILFSRRPEGAPSSWTFRFHFSEVPSPMVCVYLMEETVSAGLDLNGIRREYRLTRRETDILRYALNGLKNAEIADDLEISEQTVKDHLSNVYMKTGTANRMDLLRRFLNRS